MGWDGWTDKWVSSGNGMRLSPLILQPLIMIMLSWWDDNLL